MTNSDLISDFFKACDSRNCDVIMEYFSDDAVWINIPIDPPNKGKDQIRSTIEWFYSMFSETYFQIERQVEGSNGVVMNERIDLLQNDNVKIKLPVMGVFKIQNGKIVEWKDYFDKSALGL